MVRIVLRPARTVISSTGTPAAAPSRSTATSRGAASWWASANRNAAASVASCWRLVLLSPTRRTTSILLLPWSMRSRQGAAPARSPFTPTTLAPTPVIWAAQRSAGSIDVDMRRA
jgi:hypothetical protein